MGQRKFAGGHRLPYSYGSLYGPHSARTGRVMIDPPGGRAKRDVSGLTRGVGTSRFLVRPNAFAGRPSEPASIALCSMALAVVFIAEIGTPTTVVESLSLAPVLVAAWLFSNRAATLVALVAIGFFSLSVIAEPQNRSTLVIVALVTVAAAILVRYYAVSLAAAMSSAPPLGLKLLTRRELDVARLAAEGHRASEISAQLHIGERTVESHLASIYSKLGINSKSKLIRMASTLPADDSPGLPK